MPKIGDRPWKSCQDFTLADIETSGAALPPGKRCSISSTSARARRRPRVLDNAPIAVLLAILPANFAAQEHDGRQLSGTLAAVRIDLVGTTADFRRSGPRHPLPLNHLPGENRGMVGRIGEVRLTRRGFPDGDSSLHGQVLRSVEPRHTRALQAGFTMSAGVKVTSVAKRCCAAAAPSAISAGLPTLRTCGGMVRALPPSRHIPGLVAARRPHQSRLEQNRGGQRAD